MKHQLTQRLYWENSNKISIGIAAVVRAHTTSPAEASE
ncbi:hypothetical protein EV13_1501 [Prochlorococcus sp. MIT 0702]|nr:hypothetical protein EV13_1501 [Prochlorococcus sp. MIT 0702]